MNVLREVSEVRRGDSEIEPEYSYGASNAGS
jgi:hypothetical protein